MQLKSVNFSVTVLTILQLIKKNLFLYPSGAMCTAIADLVVRIRK